MNFIQSKIVFKVKKVFVDNYCIDTLVYPKQCLTVVEQKLINLSLVAIVDLIRYKKKYKKLDPLKYILTLNTQKVHLSVICNNSYLYDVPLCIRLVLHAFDTCQPSYKRARLGSLEQLPCKLEIDILYGIVSL